MAPLLAVAAGVASFGVVRWLTRPQPSELAARQDVPADVRAEIAAVWGSFEVVFADRLTCIDDVEVLLVGEVGGGDARYLPDDALIEIEIPTTPARFRESLAHELAHHVEATCGEFAALRDRLHPVLGGVAVPWDSGPVWFEVPSERWAEHVTELINGERVRHVDEVPIDPDVLAEIAAWGAG